MLISFVCSNQEMRISSFLILAKEYSDELNVIGYDCSDDTGKYVKELGCDFLVSDKNNWYKSISCGKMKDDILVINLHQNMSLEKLNDIINSNIDVSSKSQITLKDNKNTKNTLKSKKIDISKIKDIEDISWLYLDKIGFGHYISNENGNYFSQENVKIDFEINEVKLKQNNTKKLKKKSLKNPLVIFGIPGFIMMFSSFILVYNVIGKYDSIDSVSMGTAIITIGTTLLGILFLMSGIISYFVGKQTEFILTNYSD